MTWVRRAGYGIFAHAIVLIPTRPSHRVGVVYPLSLLHRAAGWQPVTLTKIIRPSRAICQAAKLRHLVEVGSLGLNKCHTIHRLDIYHHIGLPNHIHNPCRTIAPCHSPTDTSSSPRAALGQVWRFVKHQFRCFPYPSSWLVLRIREAMQVSALICPRLSLVLWADVGRPAFFESRAAPCLPHLGSAHWTIHLILPRCVGPGRSPPESRTGRAHCWLCRNQTYRQTLGHADSTLFSLSHVQGPRRQSSRVFAPDLQQSCLCWHNPAKPDMPTPMAFSSLSFAFSEMIITTHGGTLPHCPTLALHASNAQARLSQHLSGVTASGNARCCGRQFNYAEPFGARDNHSAPSYHGG